MNISFNTERCKGCGYCVEYCPVQAVRFTENINEKGYQVISVNKSKCVGCGSCYQVCPDCVFQILEEK